MHQLEAFNLFMHSLTVLKRLAHPEALVRENAIAANRRADFYGRRWIFPAGSVHVPCASPTPTPTNHIAIGVNPL